MEPGDDHRHDEHGRLQPRWSELGFHDLGDDEAFLVWIYRCWQQDDVLAATGGHRLMALLRQDRLDSLMADLLALFRAYGRDSIMRENLQGFPLLTWREEALLALLSGESEPQSQCDAEARRCRDGLLRHAAQVRHPRHIPRTGRDRLELHIARSFGAEWEPPTR